MLFNLSSCRDKNVSLLAYLVVHLAFVSENIGGVHKGLAVVDADDFLHAAGHLECRPTHRTSDV